MTDSPVLGRVVSETGKEWYPLTSWREQRGYTNCMLDLLVHPPTFLLGWPSNHHVGMAPDDDTVDVEANYRRIDGDYVIRVKIMRVPESEKFPEGVKYRLHFGTVDGETIVRYDNSHGLHERHEGDEVEHIEFPGVEALVKRFEADIDDRL